MSTFNELMNLRGRTALVTGATGHLGQVICETLAELGAGLVLVDLPKSDLDQLADRIRKSWGVPVFVASADLGSAADREMLFETVTSQINQMDILINNAAFVGTSALEGWAVPFESQSADNWKQVLEVNLTAVFDLSQRFAGLLSQSSGGSIINIGSIYGDLGPDWRLYEGTQLSNPAAYSASKGGVIQLSRWLATTVAPKIRVNAISPGGIYRGQPNDFVERYASKTPLGRMATEDDIRGAIGYLASDLSKYVTGQNLHIDGGWSAW